jgi:hypothetical protein
MTDKAIEVCYKKGDALVLEDDSCLAQYLHADDLKTMVQRSGVKLDLVFMATCHSESAARIFLEAGSHHVVGINRDNKVADEVVLTFTKSFYAKLWRERSKICECFETAKHTVEMTHGTQNAQHFCLFKAHASKKCVIYGNFQLGKPTFKKEKSLLWGKAPNVLGFEGYQDLKQKLITKFLSPKVATRFVRCIGQAGVGKSALARHTVNYVQERGFLEGGCIYLNCRYIDDLEVLKEQTCRKVQGDASGSYEFM